MVHLRVRWLQDTDLGTDSGKPNLEWFPSLNLDDGLHKAEALDMLSTFLREDSQQLCSGPVY